MQKDKPAGMITRKERLTLSSFFLEKEIPHTLLLLLLGFLGDTVSVIVLSSLALRTEAKVACLSGTLAGFGASALRMIL